MDTQTLIALAVVLVTVVLFIVSAAKKRGKPGCGGGCDCGK